MIKKMFRLIGGTIYSSSDGEIIKREFGEAPNGDNFRGRWVYRDKDGNVIGYDSYIHDLASQYNLDLSK